MQYSLDSKLTDLMLHPIGADIIDRILLFSGRQADILRNPLVKTIKLKALPKLSKGMVDEEFLNMLVALLNRKDEMLPVSEKDNPFWWKSAVFYQIYPQSFYDSNGDGVGDLPGVIAKLDYLKDLGVDAIWISPFYDSPLDDNGYDVRDYRKILERYGTTDDFKALSAALKQRDMKLIVDMVLNHTSDEHVWFQNGIDPASTYHDYYIWKEQPNNWKSLFSGSAWRFFPENSLYALHLFSSKQMDLNWENPTVRREMADILNFWLDLGVDGFRLDVINFIAKDSFEDGSKMVGDLIGFTGIEHYFYGAHLHDYLRELYDRAFARNGVVTVGEMPGTGLNMNKLLTGDGRKELNMVFNFDHIDNAGHTRFEDYAYDLTHLKNVWDKWQKEFSRGWWNTLFFENHDNPRMVSKVSPSGAYACEIAKLLAVIQFTLRGTPFVYQGQELGACNVDFKDIGEISDVESLNLYRELLPKEGAKKAFEIVLSGSRDHARTPMQWDGTENAGFSTGTPWIKVNGECVQKNVQAESADEYSVLSFYKKAIALRKENEALIYGGYRLAETAKHCWCYFRSSQANTFYIEVNLTGKEVSAPQRPSGLKLVLSNYQEQGRTLRPYEENIYRVG